MSHTASSNVLSIGDIKCIMLTYDVFINKYELAIVYRLKCLSVDNVTSNKLKNQILALALCFVYKNFARSHKSLIDPYQRTPAMALGVSDLV